MRNREERLIQAGGRAAIEKESFGGQFLQHAVRPDLDLRLLEQQHVVDPDARRLFRVQVRHVLLIQVERENGLAGGRRRLGDAQRRQRVGLVAVPVAVVHEPDHRNLLPDLGEHQGIAGEAEAPRDRRQREGLTVAPCPSRDVFAFRPDPEVVVHALDERHRFHAAERRMATGPRDLEEQRALPGVRSVGNHGAAVPTFPPLLESAVGDQIPGMIDEARGLQRPQLRILHGRVGEAIGRPGACGQLRQQEDEFVVGHRKGRGERAIGQFLLLALLVIDVKAVAPEPGVVDPATEDPEDLQEDRLVDELFREGVRQRDVDVEVVGTRRGSGQETHDRSGGKKRHGSGPRRWSLVRREVRILTGDRDCRS